MLKGYAKADETALAVGLLGAAVGAAVGSKYSKNKRSTLFGAVLGAVGGQAIRAFADPALEAERAQLQG